MEMVSAASCLLNSKAGVQCTVRCTHPWLYIVKFLRTDVRMSSLTTDSFALGLLLVVILRCVGCGIVMNTFS